MSHWKALNDFRLVVAICAAISATACSSSEKSDPYAPRGTTQEENGSKDKVYKGPLFNAFKTIQENKHLEKCDKKLSDIQKTLITALDAKSIDILKASLLDEKKITPSYLPFAKSYLVNAPKTSGTAGWKNQAYSWQRAYDYFRNFNDNSTEFWFKLDTYVRSIITDDHKRVVDGNNLFLGHEQAEKLSELKEVIEACKTDTRCTQPRWDEDELKIISDVPAYAYYQNAIEHSRYASEQRSNINAFFERIEADYDLHRVNFNSMITHRKADGKHVYSLPLDGSNFSLEERILLEKTITSVWSNDRNTVEIAWNNTNASTNLFHFIFKLDPNNRSFVDFGFKEIHIFPFTALRTIAHEFGHVLGFSDHYYTLWNPETCEYSQQNNDEDIMSNSETGEVTDTEWQVIFDQYGRR